MNAKLTGFTITAAPFASGAFAGQLSGRDSVYAEAGSTSIKTTPGAALSGRGSIYATELPAPTKRNLKVDGLGSPGRA